MTDHFPWGKPVDPESIMEPIRKAQRRQRMQDRATWSAVASFAIAVIALVVSAAALAVSIYAIKH